MAPTQTKFYIFSWKSILDDETPWWKTRFYWLIYRPFNHFCRFRLGLPTFNAEECCGCKRRLLWTEHQGIADTQEQALWACGKREWGYHELPYNSLEPERTVNGNHNYPASDERTRQKYADQIGT